MHMNVIVTPDFVNYVLTHEVTIIYALISL